MKTNSVCKENIFFTKSLIEIAKRKERLDVQNKTYSNFSLSDARIYE